MNNKSGYIYAILSATIFGITPIMTKYLILLDVNPITASFYRMMLWLIPIYILCKFYLKLDMKVSKTDLFQLSLAGIFFGGTSITLFSSYKYLDVGTAESIHFIYPCIIFIVMSMIFKNKPTKSEIVALIFSLGGVFLLADFKDVWGISGLILSALSAFCFGFYSIIVEKSNMSYMNIMKSLFYVNLVGAILTGIYAIIFKIPINYQFDIKGWGFLFFYSFLLTLGATLMYQLAVLKIGATKTGILSTAEPIVSVIAGFLFLNEILTIKQIIAVILILLAAIYIINKSDNSQEEIN